MQVVKTSDVLFLFGGAAAVRDTLKSVKDDLKGNQIIVPVTKDGDIDNFQVIQHIEFGGVLGKGCLSPVCIFSSTCIHGLDAVIIKPILQVGEFVLVHLGSNVYSACHLVNIVKGV